MLKSILTLALLAVSPISSAQTGLVNGKGTGITDAAAFRAALGVQRPADTDATIFFDDFNRADTANNSVGTAPSGQTWTTTSDAGNSLRIAAGALVQVSPLGTYYAWPQLEFTPTRVGCLVRFRAGGGGTSYVAAMAMTDTPTTLTGKMIHFTLNANNAAIEMWNGGTGLGNLQTLVFSEPLQDNRLYRFEWEVDAANDRVTVYGPGGEVLVYNDPLVSDAVSPNIFFEVSSTATSLKLMDFDAVWATNSASGRTHYEGRIAAAMARAANAPSIAALTGLTGNITSTAGVLSMAADTNTTHILGRARISFPSSDYAGFGHVDHTAFGSAALYQGNFGNTGLYASTGQSVAIGIANTPVAIVQAGVLTINTSSQLAFEGSTSDVNETILTVEDPTADRTYRLANAPTTSTLTVAGVLTKTDTGDPASGYEGQIVINTVDNTAKIFADGGWRTLASGW